MTPRLALAKTVSQYYHQGQTYGTSEDYFGYHIEGVVSQLAVHNLSEDYLIVAYLHDTIEDTSLTRQTIEELFGEDVAEAVVALTYRAFDKNETRDAYIKRCAMNKIARVVKLHDATFNATNCLKNKNKTKFNYYTKTIYLLSLID